MTLKQFLKKWLSPTNDLEQYQFNRDLDSVDDLK